MSLLGWLPPLRAELETRCAAWSVPLGVVVGWIQAESGGNPVETTSLKEYGLFQIIPGESVDLGFDHERIHTDEEYGIDCGFRLVDHYRLFIRSTSKALGLGVADGSELSWRFAKFAHSIGLGADRRIMTAAGEACSSWDRFSAFCGDHRTELLAKVKHDPVKWIGLVNRVFEIGAPYGVEALICASPR